MTDFDTAALASWYRTAMGTRMEELLGHRADLLQGRREGEDAVRRVGHALRGSGASYGFPQVTAAGTLLEECPTDQLLRWTDGTLSVLSRVVGPGEAPAGPFAWLAEVNGVEEPDPGAGLEEAWAVVGERAGRSGGEVAAAVAHAYGLAVADLDDPPARAAVRLLPGALAHRLMVLPLREDGTHIVVATADPVSATTEVELRRVTGRDPRPAIAEPGPLRLAVAQVFEDGDVGAVPRKGGAGERERTVLVAEDDRVTRLIVAATLERKGYRVVLAEDGREALEHLEAEGGVDLAVVDLEMPHLGGREFLQEVRGRAEWASLPVVVVTGAQDPLVEADLIEAGADDYIHKPLDPRLFLARVAATLRRAGG